MNRFLQEKLKRAQHASGARAHLSRPDLAAATWTAPLTLVCEEQPVAFFVGLRRPSDWACARCGQYREEELLEIFDQGGKTWGVLPCFCRNASRQER